MFAIKTAAGYYAGPRRFVPKRYDATWMTEASCKAVMMRYSLVGRIISINRKED